MTLKAIRRLFVEWSGQAHLMNEDGSDAGADTFIRAAADILDETLENPKSVARHVVSLVAGDYKVEIPRCLSIFQVWIMGVIDGTTSRRQLKGPKTAAWLRSEYDEPWTSLTRDTPEYFGLNVIGLDGSQWDYTRESNGALEDVNDTEDIKVGSHFEYDGILFLPPANTTYVMNVYGNFYQKKLELDTDINYWTIVKPTTLVTTACMIFERSMRNFEGVKNWSEALKPDILGIEKAVAARDSDGSNEIEG